jgi:adenylyl-sulfate kinase
MKDLIPHQYTIGTAERTRIKGHLPQLIWFTGLSGSGKSTIADHLERVLNAKGLHTMNLDGDALRLGLNADLGFSEADRTENIRRTAQVGKLLTDAGLIVLAALVSPFEKDRQHIKEAVGSDRFLEIHVSTPLETCEQRDVKGLYAKARRGEISHFTGISSPYEIPRNPDLSIDTTDTSIEEAVKQILDLLHQRKIIS